MARTGTFPTLREWSRRLAGSRVFKLRDMRCPDCDWTAEDEIGWPFATEGFLRAGPICRHCGAQLMAEIEGEYDFRTQALVQ